MSDVPQMEFHLYFDIFSMLLGIITQVTIKISKGDKFI